MKGTVYGCDTRWNSYMRQIFCIDLDLDLHYGGGDKTDKRNWEQMKCTKLTKYEPVNSIQVEVVPLDGPC